MTDLLRITDLHCSIGKQPILHGISFAIKAGELCALLGPSGCGKTTLLRCLAGFQQNQSGTIVLDQRDITNLDAAKRGIGFIFQDYALFPHMTVSQNIGYGIHKDANKDARIKEMLSLTGLEDFASRYPHELSGGQQQRVAIARALAPKPTLLLMDEPFSNLDTELRKTLSLSIRELLKEAGTTAILVTHDQTEAFAFSDYVGVVNQGRLEQWGTPYALYHEPATRFVAEFTGQGQLINATVKGDQLLTAFGAISHTLNVAEGSSINLLSRPDDWQFSADGVEVSIRNKQFIGSQTLYHVASPDGQMLRLVAPSHDDYPIGSLVRISPIFEHIITF